MIVQYCSYNTNMYNFSCLHKLNLREMFYEFVDNVYYDIVRTTCTLSYTVVQWVGGLVCTLTI